MTEETFAEKAEALLESGDIGPTIDDLNHLAMRDIRYAKARIAELELSRHMDHTAVDSRYDQLTESDRRMVADFEAQCEAYMKRRLKALQPGDKRSIERAWLSIFSRTPGMEIKRTDDKALETWAKEHGFMRPIAAVEACEEVDWKRLRQVLVAENKDKELPEEGVELIPGVTAKPQEPTITVDVEEQK
jgi:hypothetical protein